MIDSPLLKNLRGCVAGRWADADSRATLAVQNPATAEVLATVPDMGAAETTRAIEAADVSLAQQSSLPQRAATLAKIADGLIANKDEFARIITLEQGKPLKESAGEVEYAAGFFRFFSTRLDALDPEKLPGKTKNLDWTVHHRPAGVAALITPWNFPLAMLAKKLSAAIGAGCAVIVKPAELTPLTAIALWNLLENQDLLDARLNLVVGRPEPIGDRVCSHPAVRLISFTGSTATGRVLIAKSAPHVKRLALELGGNAPYIVFNDADISAAADALMANKFRCAGQTCVCANRIYVERGIEREFVEAVADRVKKLRVGNGLEPGIDLGPLINDKAVAKVRRHIDDALQRGAKRVVGDDVVAGAGHFVMPSVLTQTTPEMLLSREETFGPVVAIGSFDGEDEAVALANGTRYGLAAYVFTRDKDRADRVVARIRFGHVGINTGQGPTPEAPFGGMKQSGFGREGGIEGLLEFCETQTVAAT